MPRKTVKHNFYSPPRLHRPLITVPPALTGAAITVLSLAEPFIAAGAAVGFWYFFPTEKGLGPRGYERKEIIQAWWVPPSIRKFVFAFGKEYLCLLS
jgi:hypothetical protein